MNQAQDDCYNQSCHLEEDKELVCQTSKKFASCGHKIFTKKKFCEKIGLVYHIAKCME